MARVVEDPTGEDMVVEAGPAPEVPAEPETADEDLLIDREDLGPGAATLIAAGDPIPAELAGLPRRPRAAKARTRRR